MSVWTKLSEDEYATVWDRFYADFKFKPNYHERTIPAIVEPRPFVTFDLSSKLSEDTRCDIGKLLLDSFLAITAEGDEMYSLDWQHKCYRFEPHNVINLGPIGWYPDGDYYIFLAEDFSFGTFGHPWQKSLCVFGMPLLQQLERPLRRILKVRRYMPG